MSSMFETHERTTTTHPLLVCKFDAPLLLHQPVGSFNYSIFFGTMTVVCQGVFEAAASFFMLCFGCADEVCTHLSASTGT